MKWGKIGKVAKLGMWKIQWKNRWQNKKFDGKLGGKIEKTEKFSG